MPNSVKPGSENGGKARPNKFMRLGQVLGWCSLAFMSGTTLLAFFGLLNFSGQGFDFGFLQDPYLWQIIEFTFIQAIFSAGLSLLFAWPVALALLHKRDSWHKRIFLSFCILCFVMPTLIVITGLVALLGHQGLVGRWMWEGWNLYGLTGILIAHVYLNFPFAVRCIYLQLQAIPASRWKLARQLKLSRWQRFRYLEWPSAQLVSWLATGFILVLCFNSFAVVLALGGGPQATTLEVAIYQALKYDFNIPEALILAWLQLILAGSLYLLVTTLGQLQWLGNLSQERKPLPSSGKFERLLYNLFYGIAWCVMVAPLIALLPKIFSQPLTENFWQAIVTPTMTSLVLAALATTIALGLAYLVLQPYRIARRLGTTTYIWIDGLASHALVIPAMVLSVGIFVFFIRKIDLDIYGMVFVCIINALVSVPFALSQLKGPLLNYDQSYRHLLSTLKLSRWQRFTVEWQFMKPAIRSATAFVAVLTLGDVAIYSIFGHQDFVTLPWLIYSYASTYRMTEAAMAAILLLIICSTVVAFLEYQRRPRSKKVC